MDELTDTDERRPLFSKSGLGCLIVMLVAGGYLYIVYAPSFLAARAQGQVTACKRNMKEIAEQCKLFFQEHDRHVTSLDKLEMKIPKCPVAREDTYSSSYSVGADQSFTLFCQGDHHTAWGRLPENHPRYHSTEGFVEPKK